jgi:hypothetical protein
MSTHPTNEPKDVEAELQKQLAGFLRIARKHKTDLDMLPALNDLVNFVTEVQAHTRTDTFANIRAKLPKDALAVRQDWQGLNWLDGCNDVINLVTALLTRLEKEGEDNG